MKRDKKEDLQVIYDVLERSAVIVMGKRTATVPVPLYNQREANVMGREFARKLGWFDRSE